MLAVEEVNLISLLHISRIIYEPTQSNVVLSFLWEFSRYSRPIELPPVCGVDHRWPPHFGPGRNSGTAGIEVRTYPKSIL
jgi:hypothetical protein